MGIRMKPVNLNEESKEEKMVDEAEEDKSKVFMLFHRIFKIINENSIDIHDLYLQSDKMKSNALAINEFTTLIKAIEPNLSEY